MQSRHEYSVSLT